MFQSINTCRREKTPTFIIARESPSGRDSTNIRNHNKIISEILIFSLVYLTWSDDEETVRVAEEVWRKEEIRCFSRGVFVSFWVSLAAVEKLEMKIEKFLPRLIETIISSLLWMMLRKIVKFETWSKFMQSFDKNWIWILSFTLEISNFWPLKSKFLTVNVQNVWPLKFQTFDR